MEITVPHYFVSGGTLQVDAPSYVVRRADTALRDALLRGEFCYVLDTRQVGKSSLMVRTAAALRRHGLRVAVLDLTAYGQNLSVEQWYFSLLVDLADQIGMTNELVDFWRQNRELGPLPRLLAALRQVALGNDAAPLVLFIDEIDAVRSLAFSADELFAGIRECYNRRAQDAVYSQLTFCLLGVATPVELISDAHSTPFNIGRRIELNDFTLEEAMPLAAGLVKTGARRQMFSPATPASRLLARVIYWTGGHPYLTQICCQALAEQPQITGVRGVDRLCQTLFFSHQAQRTDDNLMFVRNRLLQSGGDIAGLLDLYGQVLARWGGVRNDEKSVPAAILCLAGIVRLENGYLRPRNRIYRRVFDRAWIRANMPYAELRRQRTAFQRGLLRATAIAGVIVMAMFFLVWNAQREAKRADQAEQIARQLLYAADINAGQQTVTVHNFEFLRQLMSAHRHEPWGYEWRYLWKTSHQAYRTYVGHKYALMSIAYSPDGRYLATASLDTTVKIWNVFTSKVVRTLLTGQSKVNAVVYSPNGRWLASGTNDGNVILWDATTAKTIYKRHLSDRIFTLKFSPDSKLLAIGNMDELQVLEVQPGRVKWTSNLPDTRVFTLAFSPDGKQIASASARRTIQTWETATGRPLYTLGKGYFNITSLAYSPDGKLLAVANSKPTDNEVHLWNVSTRREIKPLRDDSIVYYVAFAPDGKRLATTGNDNTITLWNLVTRQREQILEGHSRIIDALAYSPDGHWLATASFDATAKLWNTQSKRPVHMQDIDPETYCAFAFNGLQLAAAPHGKPVRLYDTRTGNEIVCTQVPANEVSGIACSPDGRKLAVACDKQNRVDIYDVATGKPIQTLVLPTAKITALCFAPNGKWLAIGSDRRSAFIWDLSRSCIYRRFRTEPDMIMALAFSPDSSQLVTGGLYHVITQWDVATGRKQKEYKGHVKSITALAFAPDGQTLASSADEAVCTWNVTTGRETLYFADNHAYVNAIQFTDHGNVLQACLSGGTLREWHAADPTEIAADPDLD